MKRLRTDDDTVEKDEEGESQAQVARTVKVGERMYDVLNRKDAGGQTHLHRAARNGELNTVKWLLDIGLDPNNKDNDGETPFYQAGLGYYSEIMKLLISAGANVDEPDNQGPGNTILYYLASFLHESDQEDKWQMECVKVLVEAGANINLPEV